MDSGQGGMAMVWVFVAIVAVAGLGWTFFRAWARRNHSQGRPKNMRGPDR